MKFGNSILVAACAMLQTALGVVGEEVTSEKLQNDILEVEYAQPVPLPFLYDEVWGSFFFFC